MVPLLGRVLSCTILTARYRRLYHNHERVRTCNSVLTGVPGLFASVNNVTDPETDTIVSYISPAGIPSIANQTDQYLEVVTPYASWPTILFDRGVGLAWWRNMAAGKKMQSEHKPRITVGSTQGRIGADKTQHSRPIREHRVQQSRWSRRICPSNMGCKGTPPRGPRRWGTGSRASEAEERRPVRNIRGNCQGGFPSIALP